MNTITDTIRRPAVLPGPRPVRRAGAIEHVHISRVEPHPANVRADLGDLTELADSIRVHGILQPLVVQPHPARPGAYQVLAGHRRLAAARLARRDHVPVVVRQLRGPSAPADATIIMLAENLHRADLSPVEKARAMGSLRDDHDLNASQIAQLTGLAPSTVSYYLSLLELDEPSRERVASGTVQVGDAIAAVRQSRELTRRRNGHASPRPKVTVGPDPFSYRHPLASLARAMCETAAHTVAKTGQGRPGEGKVACGGCWEAVIRADERARLNAQPGH